MNFRNTDVHGAKILQPTSRLDHLHLDHATDQHRDCLPSHLLAMVHASTLFVETHQEACLIMFRPVFFKCFLNLTEALRLLSSVLHDIRALFYVISVSRFVGSGLTVLVLHQRQESTELCEVEEPRRVPLEGPSRHQHRHRQPGQNFRRIHSRLTTLNRPGASMALAIAAKSSCSLLGPDQKSLKDCLRLCAAFPAWPR